MLAEYLSTTVDDAFQLLRICARGHNHKLADVAATILGREIPSSELARRPGQR